MRLNSIHLKAQGKMKLGALLRRLRLNSVKNTFVNSLSFLNNAIEYDPVILNLHKGTAKILYHLHNMKHNPPILESYKSGAGYEN
jgi:hypothetical protein